MRAAATYYQDRVLGLGDEFLAEIERVCARLSEQQSLGPRLDADHRRIALRRFPFGLNRLHLTENPRVGGSIPPLATINFGPFRSHR